MKCPNCSATLREVHVQVQGAQQKALSYQCPSCDYFSFDQSSSRKVIEELRETPLKIKQKVVKLSGDRLGIYFNKNVVESLGITKGDEISLSVPDKKHIVIELS